jgi:hypothetical protein
MGERKAISIIAERCEARKSLHVWRDACDTFFANYLQSALPIVRRATVSRRLSTLKLGRRLTATLEKTPATRLFGLGIANAVVR